MSYQFTIKDTFTLFTKLSTLPIEVVHCGERCFFNPVCILKQVLVVVEI